MFTYHTTVYLRDTDATGVLYFAEQFRMALEAFEQFLKKRGVSLGVIIDEEEFLMPIVHAESDYFAPLKTGDELEISLEVGKIGTSSFILNYKILNKSKNIPAGTVSIVHVAVSRKTGTSIPIPEKLQALLKHI